MTTDQTFRQVLTEATPEERAAHARASADRLIQDIADAQRAVNLRLTAAEGDLLRFILGTVEDSDFTSAADAAVFQSILTKMGA